MITTLEDRNLTIEFAIPKDSISSLPEMLDLIIKSRLTERSLRLVTRKAWQNIIKANYKQPPTENSIKMKMEILKAAPNVKMTEMRLGPSKFSITICNLTDEEIFELRLI